MPLAKKSMKAVNFDLICNEKGLWQRGNIIKKKWSRVKNLIVKQVKRQCKDSVTIGSKTLVNLKKMFEKQQLIANNCNRKFNGHPQYIKSEIASSLVVQ